MNPTSTLPPLKNLNIYNDTRAVMATLQIRKTKGEEQLTSTWLHSSVNLGPSTPAHIFPRPALWPPPSIRWLTGNSSSSTFFNLIWYHCPNFASYMFIFKREGSIGPLEMDHGVQDMTSKTGKGPQGMSSLTCLSYRGHRHFISSVPLQPLRNDHCVCWSNSSHCRNDSQVSLL